MGFIPILKKYYPDELIYSWICRLAKANGLTLEEFCDAYLGTIKATNGTLSYDIKRKFALLCESMYRKTDVVKLFLNTNTFRFEAILMEKGQQAKVVNSVFGIQNKLNRSINYMKKSINICPECMKEDIEKFGEPYLHCSHQLFGVQTCYKHKCLLYVFTGTKGYACDYNQKDYTEIHTKISIESNNAYSEYTHALFQANINANKQIIKNILTERIKEMGTDQFLDEFGKWKYHDLVDYTVEKVWNSPKNLLKKELIPMVMFLYPDVNEVIQKMEEKYLNPIISEYTCSNCGKNYISTPFLNEELFGCPFCNIDRSEQEILSDISEKNGYELKSDFKSISGPVTLFHRKCGNVTSITPQNFLFKKVRCLCETRITREKAKQQIEKSGLFELIEYTNTSSSCKIRAKECGHTFEIYYSNFLRLPRCRICFPKNMTTERLAKRIRKETKGEYKLVGEYIDADTKIKILHNVCGTITECMPRNYCIGKVCPVCNAKNENEHWNKMFRNLCNYKNTFGNMKVSAKIVYDGESLATWCLYQRRAYKAGTLSEEHLEKLKSIGFMFYPKEADWDRRFEQYKRYIKKNGKRISVETEFEGEKLGRWAQKQRMMYKKGELSAEHFEKLQSVGFIFDLAEDDWDWHFEQYKRYINENNGNSYILQRMDYEGDSLGAWMNRQRMLYKKGELSAERFEKLQSVGFIFDPEEDEWNRHFEQYKRYINENNGNPYIPQRMDYEGEHLGSWVGTQRKRYKEGRLSEEQYQKLKEIRFIFEPLEDEWDRLYKVYQIYINENGGNPYIAVTEQYRGENLGSWVHVQRRAYKEGKLSQERYEKLRSVGFIFDIFENEWMRRYEQYKRYINENNGKTYIPRKMDYEGEHLGAWAYEQRMMYKRGELSAEHYEKLKNVGFVFKLLEDEWGRRYEQYKRYIKNNNGNPYIPYRMDYEGEHLGKWVSYQRSLYKAGKLSQERHEKLKKLGMKFE